VLSRFCEHLPLQALAAVRSLEPGCVFCVGEPPLRPLQCKSAFASESACAPCLRTHL
jgi:hypothetical protein